jgi:hypothetical protein
MPENDERYSNQLSKIDEIYGYEQPIEEEEEQKSIAQQLVDAIKQRRQKAFGGIKRTI